MNVKHEFTFDYILLCPNSFSIFDDILTIPIINEIRDVINASFDQHLDNGLLTEEDIAEVEALAQAYYDALDAEDSKEEATDDTETVS